MALRFRKAIKLPAGLKFNIGKTGIGISGGIRGARIGVNKRGTYTSFGIPGTGVSTFQYIGKNKTHGSPHQDQSDMPPPTEAQTSSQSTQTQANDGTNQKNWFRKHLVSPFFLGCIVLLAFIGIRSASTATNTPTASNNTEQVIEPTNTPIPIPTDTPTATPYPTLLPTRVPTPTFVYTPPTATPLPPQQINNQTETQQAAPQQQCAGATALCSDGSCSYATHPQGACSHHGGVVKWYN